MVSPVTDPELLRLLNGEQGVQPQGAQPQGAQPVTDPQLLALLNSGEPANTAPTEPSKGGFLPELGRQLGLTGRALAGGAAQAVEPFTEPVRYLMNKALPGNPVGNVEAATDQLLTQAGVPEPQGGLERGVQSVGRFVAGAGAGAGAANTAERGVYGALGLTKNIRPEAMTTEQLREIGTAAYKAADDAGVVIHPGSFKNFAERVAGITRSAGIDRDIHPKATAAVRRIAEAAEEGKPLKLEELEILRRVTQGARGSIEKDERRIGGMIAEELDDYLTRMGANDVIAGDPQAASTALKTARDVWTRMSKSSMLEDAVEQAGIRAGQFSGSGFENALRTQFRQIAMNPKRMRGFSKAEQDAIKKVASGGPVDNAMRYLGKLAPTGIVSGGIGASMGYGAAGVPGAMAVPALGLAGRATATRLTGKNVNNALDLVRRGAPLPKDTPEWLLPWLSGGIFGADTQE